jgi:hypothetical protein
MAYYPMVVAPRAFVLVDAATVHPALSLVFH